MTERPPRIARGQILGVVGPGGPIERDSLVRGLERLGDLFQIRVADSVMAPHPEGVPNYLSASDQVRAAELNAMLRDPDVRAIVLARGGYGLTRILPLLDVAALQRDPKPLVGFSDATALLAWAHAAGVRGIHGPMIGQLGELAASDTAHLVTLLTDPRAPGTRPWQLATHGRGTYRGPVIAGNLTMVSLLVGTPWQVPLRAAIVLLEEVGERPYEIDRYLTHLMLTGELAKPAAVIVGDLTRCEGHNPPAGLDLNPAAMATVLERLHAAGTVAASGAPVGHGTRNEAIPFGAMSTLDLDSGTFEISEGAVA